MSFRSSLLIFSAGICSLLAACSGDKKQSNGPIVLGDSSAIVTETDARYLSDYVNDIQSRSDIADTAGTKPADASPENTDTAAATAPASSQTQVAAPKGNGLQVAFGQVTVFIPGIQTKTYRNQNLERTSGASYQLQSGNLAGNQLQLSGATITKVSQRYIANVVAQNELGTLNLDALSSTSDWTPLKGNGKVYVITGADRPEVKNASAAQIRAAVSRAARNKRMSRQNVQKWENALRNVRSVNQAPLKVVLRSLMWKIEGKDATGKAFQKQVRIDLPA